MKRIAPVLAVSAFSLMLMGSTSRADAGSLWIGGAGFSVGGVHFSFGVGHHHHGARYVPRYYYRTSYRLRYDGYRCDSACYVRDGYYYHAPSCPLLGHHLEHYGAGSYRYYDSWRAPLGHDHGGRAYRRHDAYRYRDGHRRDNYDRRDHYDHRDHYDRRDHHGRRDGYDQRHDRRRSRRHHH